MEKDTLQTIIDSTASVAQLTNHSMNVWLIVAIVELAVIVLLLLSRSKCNAKRTDIKKKVLSEGEVDFANLMNSTFNAEKLYKELIVKCHPDRFAPDETKMAIANELSSQITKNKHDIKRLEVLREEAKNKLNINL